MTPPAARTLQALAWANVALHALGLVVAWFGLQPGSVVAPLTERMAYLADRPAAWNWGWGIWMVCCLLLVSFMAVLWRLLPGKPAAAQLALILTSVGMAADLLCDVIQIQVLPLAAGAGPSQPDLFLAFERLAFTGGLTVANGLYTSGVLLMNVCLRGLVGTPARFAGWATVVAGLALAAAGFIPSTLLLQGATGATIGFYSLWTVLVARDLRQLGEHGR
jgi:hypothetical protein